MRIAIVGAGMAGLSCGVRLRDAGVDVTVVDKGRGPGGRTSTRRAAVPFDHGAQYFTARDVAFQAAVVDWLSRGIVAEWMPRVVAFDGADDPRAASDLPRFVGVPGMNALAIDMASRLDVRTGVTVSALYRRTDGWHLATAADESIGPFDAVLLTPPPPQTATLLADHPFASVVRTAEVAPCWAVMTSWADAVPVAFDAAFVNEGPLSWVARDGGKPGRPHPHTWVLQASPAWSIEHLEQTPDEVLPAMLQAFEALVRAPLPALAFSAAHRWRYASVPRPLAETHLWDGTAGLGVAGDWCGGPRVEGAWLSGRALADALVRTSSR
jgi:predicted NAD/FAD-dependent oxidoreductase